MTETVESTSDTARDLIIERVIAAPRERVWAAWADPVRLEQWWVPAPAVSRVTALELRPGGAFTTLFAEEPGGELGPHTDNCFLAVEEARRLVFTNALVGGWRPAADPFLLMTAEITFDDHPTGTFYRARVLHRSAADRDHHDELGFHDGWGTVTRQLAELVERA